MTKHNLISASQVESVRNTEQINVLLQRVQELEQELLGAQRQIQAQQQQLHQQHIQLQQKQAQPVAPAGDSAIRVQLEAKINQLDSELREERMRYKSLEEEQEELLIALAKFEIENNNLKERLAQLGPDASLT